MSPRRTRLVIVCVPLGVLVILLLSLQGFLGWPFSAGATPRRYERPPVSASAPAPAPRAPVEIPPSRWSKLGIRVINVRRETIGGELRTALTLVPDETRLARVHAPFAGTIAEVHVSAGDHVEAGAPLFTIDAPELWLAQKDFVAARNETSALAARDRLHALAMTDTEIDALTHGAEISSQHMVSAPRAGIVLLREVVAGAAADPATESLVIADLSRLWATGELPDLEGAGLILGMPSTILLPSSGLDPIDSELVFIERDPSEHRLRVAFGIDDPQHRLSLGTIGSAIMEIEARPALVVPRAAIVDTGSEQHVFVLAGRSSFVPRSVRIGVQRGTRVEIAEGLEVGERVASQGVFTIDSLSRAHGSAQASIDRPVNDWL